MLAGMEKRDGSWKCLEVGKSVGVFCKTYPRI